MSKIFQKLLKFLAVGILIPLLCYVFLIMVNFIDEVKTPKVIEFEKFLAQREMIDDKSNGFVYAVGLSASPELDFYLAGVERIKHANSVSTIAASSIEQGAFALSAISETYELILQGCGTPLQLNAACNDYLLNKTKEIDQFLADSKMFLQRYKVMLDQKSWYESIQYDAYNNASLAAPWNIAHKVFMLYIWREGAKGNMNSVSQLLQEDNVFWRNAMSSTHSLVNFSLSAALIKQHYHWGRFTLNHFSNDDMVQFTPNDWLNSYIEPPFSFNNIVKGEWQFGSSILQEMFHNDEWATVFLKPLYNQQASLNLQAEVLTEAFNFEAKKELKHTVKSQCQKELSLSMLAWYSYNPIGKLLGCVAISSYGSYQNTIIEIEKQRLTALQN